MKHRILSLLVAVILCLGVCPVQALMAAEGDVPPVADSGLAQEEAQGAPRKAAARASASDISIGDGWVFAQGVPIVIRQNDRITSIYDTEGNLLSGETDVSSYQIYGGWIDGQEHTANTSIVMESGSAGYIFGGSSGGSLVGSTNVVLNGGTAVGVYGGGYGDTVEKATVELGADWNPLGFVFAGSYDGTTKSAEVIIRNYAVEKDSGRIHLYASTAQEATVTVKRDEGGPLKQPNPSDLNLIPEDDWNNCNVVVEYGTVVFMGKKGESLSLDSLDIKAEGKVGFQDWDAVNIGQLSSSDGQINLIAQHSSSGIKTPTPIEVQEFSSGSVFVLNASGWTETALQTAVFFKGSGVDAMTSPESVFYSSNYKVEKKAINGGSEQGLYLTYRGNDATVYISKRDFENGSVSYNGTISLTVGVSEQLATIEHLKAVPGAQIQIRGNNAQRVLLANILVDNEGKTADVTINGKTETVELTNPGEYVTFELPVNAALLDTSAEGLLMIAVTPDKNSNEVPMIGPDGGKVITVTPVSITLNETIPAPDFQDPLESELEEGDFYTAGVQWRPADGSAASAFQLNREYEADILLTPKEGHRLCAESIGDTVTYDGKAVPCVFNTDGTATLKTQKTAQFEGRTITVAASPAEGGTVTGGKVYAVGAQATVTAAPAQGWKFAGWEENGSIVSAEPEYSFAVNENRTLTARFEKVRYTVTLIASPAEGGTVTGGGSYVIGSQVAVSATPAQGWKFTGWKENGAVVCAEPAYSFAAAANRTLTAHFEQEQTEEPTKKVKTDALTTVPGELVNSPFNTVDKIIAELRQKVEAAISEVGDSLVVYDVRLVYEDDGREVEPGRFPEAGIDAILDYPSGTNDTDYIFTVQHMISYGPDAGKVETLTYTAEPTGLKCHFGSLSPVAIGWQKKTAPAPDPTTPTGGSSSSDSDEDNDRDDFWQEVLQQIEQAKPGATLRINAKDRDKLPRKVMNALKQSNITLVIRWSGGEDIVLSSDQALDEPRRFFYPLAYLSSYDFDAAADTQSPDTQNPDDSLSEAAASVNQNPATGDSAVSIALLLSAAACGGIWVCKGKKHAK